jgi:hypothetical protein
VTNTTSRSVSSFLAHCSRLRLAQLFLCPPRLLTLSTRLQIHLRPLLRERSHHQAAVRVAVEEQLCRQELDRKVEEAGLRKGILHLHNPLCLPDTNCSFPALLSPMHPDQGDQLQQHMHLSRASQAAQGGPNHRVRQLRVPRMWKQ